MGLKPEQVQAAKKLEGKFDTAWTTHNHDLGALSETAWKSAKALTGVQSAKWFQKSNNIGPKLKTMQAARQKFDKQVNRNNWNSFSKQLKDLSAAMGAFDKNRQGSDDNKNAQIKTFVKSYKDTVDAAHTWLTSSPEAILVVAYRDEIEGGQMVNAIDPSR